MLNWLKIFLIVCLFSLLLFFFGAGEVFAQFSSSQLCRDSGCSDCVYDSGSQIWSCADPVSIFGRVEPPPGVTAHGADPQTGVINFLNTILRLLVVVGGLWALFNIIIAGYQFMSAGGDPKAIASAWGRIWQTLLGLVLVAGSFLLAAVVGQLLFGDPRAILSPQLLGPGP